MFYLLSIQKKICQIFIDEINEHVVKIKDISKGVDQLVKIVYTDKSTYIIKIPKKHIAKLIEREFIACKKLNNLVPVPKIIAKTNQYIIEEFIKGTDLDEVSLTLEEKQVIYQELGNILKKIHSIKLTGYGYIDTDKKGCCSTLKEAILLKRNKNLLFFKKRLTKNEYTNLINYLDVNDCYADSKKSVLLHFDFEDGNIKIKNAKVVGILDFGDLSAGPPLYDLARVFISHYEDGMFDCFLKGYGKIDMDELKYYVVISLLWMIPYNNKIARRKLFKLQLKILKGIIC